MGFQDKPEPAEVSAAIAQELRTFARQKWPLANDKYRKGRLADLLNLTHRRVKSLWEADRNAVIREHEAEAIRRLVGQEEANRDDFKALQARIARLEAALFAQDEEFHHEQMAALRQAADGRRGGNVSRRSEPTEPAE